MFSTVENRVQLIGFLGQEIELKEYAEGKKMARVSMATHEQGKDKDGKKETVTSWHNLIAWGKTAEVMAKHCGKGQLLYIEGKLAYREYTGKDDVKKSSTEIVVVDFKKLDSADK
jgi:single-strand DNA-binding protein